MVKKYIFRCIAVMLALCIVCALLGGCDALIGTQEQSIQLDGSVDCYEQPDLDSAVIAVFKNGISFIPQETLMINGCHWVKSNFGWVLLDTETEATAPAGPFEGVITQDSLDVKSFPGEDGEVVNTAYAGTFVTITQTAQASAGTWGEYAEGWIPMEHVYILGETGSGSGYAVVRENGSEIYDQILEPRTGLTTLETGDRVFVYHRMDVDGSTWGYTEGGWIHMQEVYVEGDPGERPASGTISDVTPLNVREGPSIQYEILSTLENGTYVEILEQITRNGHDWGFTGSGWIFMDNVIPTN